MSLPTLTDEHAMLRRTVRAFVEKEVVPQVDAWEEAGRIPRTFWRRLGELGLLGLEFPTEYGGAGGDFLSSVVLGEEMARCRSGGVAFSVLVHTDMSSPWLTRYGTDAQKRRYLPGIVSGETVCALGITEPGTGSDMRASRLARYATATTIASPAARSSSPTGCTAICTSSPREPARAPRSGVTAASPCSWWSATRPGSR